MNPLRGAMKPVRFPILCDGALLGHRGDGRCRKRRNLSRIAARNYCEPPTLMSCIFSRELCNPISSMPDRKTCWISCRICTLRSRSRKTHCRNGRTLRAKSAFARRWRKRETPSRKSSRISAVRREYLPMLALQKPCNATTPTCQRCSSHAFAGQSFVVYAGFLLDKLSRRRRSAVFSATGPLDAARVWQPRGLRVSERRRGL